MAASKEAISDRVKARKPSNLPFLANVFLERVKEIGIEVEYTRRLGKQPPFTSPTNLFKRRAYGLILQFMRGNHIAVLKRFSLCHMRTKRQPTFLENPFYWGLLAVDPKYDMIEQNDLYYLSQQLLYAHHHHVPPEYLIGFLFQCGGRARIRQALAEGRREDDFLMVKNKRSIQLP